MTKEKIYCLSPFLLIIPKCNMRQTKGYHLPHECLLFVKKFFNSCLNGKLIKALGLCKFIA